MSRDFWDEALRDANRDKDRVLRRLGETKRQMKQIKQYREELKAELRDIEKTVSSASYAKQTGREPG